MQFLHMDENDLKTMVRVVEILVPDTIILRKKFENKFGTRLVGSDRDLKDYQVKLFEYFEKCLEQLL
jgi:hypothetical protein